MPADYCPAVTCFHDGRMIHVESDYSRPSYGGSSKERGAISAPAKVVTPELLVGMEQGPLSSCLRVFCFFLCAFEFVTGMTGYATLAERPEDAFFRHPGLCSSSNEGTRCPRHFNTMSA